jgi:integrase/recombinase XerD
MGNRTATIYINAKLDGVWKFFRPVEANNHDLKEGYALVNERARKFEPGDYRYYISWYASGKKKFQRVDGDQTVAHNLRIAKEKDLADPSFTHFPNGKSGRLTLIEAVKTYIANQTLTRAPKSVQGYTHNLNLFQKSCTKTYVDEVTADDMRDFIRYMKEKCPYTTRTQFNVLGSVDTFLRAKPWQRKGVLDREEWPRFTKKKVRAFSDDDLKGLFAKATPEEFILFQFFLGTGFREQEVSHAAYRDINFNANTVSVTAKPEFNFTPKDKEERSVRIPTYLTAALKKRQKEHANDFLIFPGEDRKVEGHMLRVLKSLALRAGLNCGHCVNKKGLKCKTHAVCSHWMLHRFRKTFATRWYLQCKDIRKVRKLLGHSDTETTEHYLEDVILESDETANEVEQAFAQFA